MTRFHIHILDMRSCVHFRENGSLISRDEKERLDLSTRREKNSENTKLAMEIPLIVFRQYLKER